ncbi:MAG: hypothetical protein Q8S84_03810 [bacterium]|nr:hypothetical protein [bacterium]
MDRVMREEVKTDVAIIATSVLFNFYANASCLLTSISSYVR